MQRWTTQQRASGASGKRIGFVPTMGCLHEGHLSLVATARRRVGPDGSVVVSIYVNPTQFGPQEDLSRYPRPLKNDLRLCREAGVDAVFLPATTVMYPKHNDASYSTYVVEEQLSAEFEGQSRPTHFRGVTTVVTKLFHCVLPDLAVFGAKDWQQFVIVKRMVQDLNFPVRVMVAPTVREPDGLALSSRNRYLNAEERAQAVVLWKVIQEARRRVRSKKLWAATALHAVLAPVLAEYPAAHLEYLAFFDSETLMPRDVVQKGTHLALAMRLGNTRLIDNARL